MFYILRTFFFVNHFLIGLFRFELSYEIILLYALHAFDFIIYLIECYHELEYNSVSIFINYFLIHNLNILHICILRFSIFHSFSFQVILLFE